MSTEKKAYIEVELTLLREDEGGRNRYLPLENEKAFYMPHIVIESGSQRNPAFRSGAREIDEEYLGVRFWPCQQTLYPGDTANVILDLMYYPAVNYDKVKPLAEFTVREGGLIVGFGRVINVYIED